MISLKFEDTFRLIETLGKKHYIDQTKFSHYIYYVQYVVTVIFVIPLYSFLYPKVTTRYDFSCDEKVVIVTGSSAGIGLEVARKLYHSGATVILACRDENKVNSIMKTITSTKSDHSHGDIHFIHLDLSNLKSIITFVNSFKQRFQRLDILINNAGINTSYITSDGLERLFQINYLGHYLLTRLLINYHNELLQTKKQLSVLRIVNLSSFMHHFGDINYKLSSLYTGKTTTNSPYNDSKLYMNLLTYQLNKLYSCLSQNTTTTTSSDHNILKTDSSNNNINPIQQHNNSSCCNNNSSSILAISVDPGGTNSEIWRDWKGVKQFAYQLIKWTFLTCDEASEVVYYAACTSHSDIQQHYGYHYKSPSSLLHLIESEPLLTGHSYIPYLIPFRSLYISLGFEALGQYGGAHYYPCSIPKHIDHIAYNLWQDSYSICEEILKKNHINLHDLCKE